MFLSVLLVCTVVHLYFLSFKVRKLQLEKHKLPKAQKSDNLQNSYSKDHLDVKNDHPSNAEKEVDWDRIYKVSLVDSCFPIAAFAINKTPNKSSVALINQIPTGMKSSLMKKSEIKKISMLLSRKTKLQIA
jgi:hypothetical protein